MTAENFQNGIDNLRKHQPLRPFTIELVSGAKFEIDFPGALASRDGVAMFLAPGGAPVILITRA